ncbi:hypothetical protein GF337_06390 [candidate division KSB1 bacterium]|nr:hypothetical protein [candidate division KSB1 bacterium]
MKYIISFFIYISGLISFLILALLVISVTMICKSYKCDKFIKTFSRLFLKTFFIRVKVEGLEKIDPDKPYIFTSNHINIFDVFILTGYIPNITRGVELDRHFEYPIWGTIIKKYGNIPISHSNPRSALKSLDKAKQTFEKGVSIIILPEGHRTRDGNLRPFMKGPFHLAMRAKADIVPTAMIGLYQIKKVTSLLVQPGKVILRIGNVVPYEHYRHLNTSQLRDLIRQKTCELLEER